VTNSSVSGDEEVQFGPEVAAEHAAPGTAPVGNGATCGGCRHQARSGEPAREPGSISLHR